MAVSTLSSAAIFDPGDPGTNLAKSTTNAGAAAGAPSASKNALNKLSGDFNSFLTLLTTQLQNQDPLQPMDSAEFTSQLVQFSSVEQEIQANKNLETMIALLGGSNASAAFNYIGREVTITNGQANLVNGGAKWTYEVDASAVSSAITITDEKGNAVFNTTGGTGIGQHVFNWDGKNKNGGALPDGVYKMTVSALSAGNKPLSSKVFSTGVVTSVDTSGATPLLQIGGLKLGLDNIGGVTQSSSSAGNASLLGYIDRFITAKAPNRNLKDGEASWTYQVSPSAINSTLTVIDSKGKAVFTTDGEIGSGAHNFTWNGKNNDGEDQPEGVYTLEISALAANDKYADSKITTSGIVTGIETVGAGSVLLIGEERIRIEDVLSVTPAGSASTTASNTN